MICEKPVHIGSKRKQNILVSDASGSCSVQLWEEHIAALEEGKTYHLEGFRIGEYNGVKYLAFSREGSKVILSKKAIEAVEPIISDGKIVDIEEPKIIAVYRLESLKSCFRCHCRVEPSSPPLGRCIECNMQDYDMCQSSTVAELLVLANSKMISLQVSGELVAYIAKTDPPTDLALMRADILRLTYDSETKEVFKILHK